LPGVQASTARRWAEQAVRRLNDLHQWKPTDDAEQALKESPAHEGFVGRATLVEDVERITAARHGALVPRSLLDGLMAIAQRAPLRARADVPVHADCDWGNWLVQDHCVTALLDFERARLGDPADDWVLLAATSGPHLDMVLNVIAEATMTRLDELRAECELRSAAFIAEDLRSMLKQPDAPASAAARVRDLQTLVLGRRWWQHNR
jgi:aminoglycoside phosphotransferase (APT) family kinase protein